MEKEKNRKKNERGSSSKLEGGRGRGGEKFQLSAVEKRDTSPPRKKVGENAFPARHGTQGDSIRPVPDEKRSKEEVMKSDAQLVERINPRGRRKEKKLLVQRKKKKKGGSERDDKKKKAHLHFGILQREKEKKDRGGRGKGGGGTQGTSFGTGKKRALVLAREKKKEHGTWRGEGRFPVWG